MSKFTFTILVLLILFGGAYYLLTKPMKQSNVLVFPSPVQNHVLGEQTKTSDCQVNGPFPDLECTPGAIFPDVTKEQICISGYSSSVRNVSSETKKQVFAEYGIYTHAKGEYEIDHFISLELGGSNDISNLFPEAANPTPGFHEKDQVENYLHDEVCSGKITLQQAQTAISTNWLQVYNQMPK